MSDEVAYSGEAQYIGVAWKVKWVSTGDGWKLHVVADSDKFIRPVAELLFDPEKVPGRGTVTTE